MGMGDSGGGEMNGNEFRFFLLCDINLFVMFCVEVFDGDLFVVFLLGGWIFCVVLECFCCVDLVWL